MPLPDFNHNHVLPPHLGNPTVHTDISPYFCTSYEFVQRFATSKKRVEILKNFITFRSKMTENGIIYGFQWIDGSFTENIEMSQGRPPNDLDLATFFGNITKEEMINIVEKFPEFANPTLSKQNYLLDHYAIDYCENPNNTVIYTQYFYQLFSHNRNQIWKGIVGLAVNTPEDDQQAFEFLNSLDI